MNRRRFLNASALSSAGVLLSPAVTGTANAQPVSSPPDATTTAPSSNDTFFKDADLNFNFLNLLGSARYGLVDVGTCLAIASQITDGDPASVVHAFTAAGDQFAAMGDAAAAAGHAVGARSAYLPAQSYTFTATYFVDGMGAPERFAPLWRRQQALWDQGAALLDPPMEKVRIPYPNTTTAQIPQQATTLPGLFLQSR